jgi:phosphinothricin acetyltransferase
MGGVTIEPLTEAHAEAGRAIYNHWVTHSTATFAEEPVDHDTFLAETLFPGDERHGSWAVLDDGEVVGYVLLAPYKSRCAYRETAEAAIYLHPDAAGRGLGGRALDFALQQAPELGLHTVLATISAENEASLRLFASRGFAESARLREVGLKFGRRIDVVVLQRHVGSIAAPTTEEQP